MCTNQTIIIPNNYSIISTFYVDILQGQSKSSVGVAAILSTVFIPDITFPKLCNSHPSDVLVFTLNKKNSNGDAIFMGCLLNCLAC